MDVLVLTREDVRRLLDPDRLIDALADGFVALRRGTVSVPPRIAASSGPGFVAAMPGWVPGAALEVKLVSVFAGNHALGLPSHQAVIVVFDESTGQPLAVMDGTEITAVRTACTSALAVRLLSRSDVSILAVLGCGVQGMAHLDAVPRVRRFAEVRVASRSFEHAMHAASHVERSASTAGARVVAVESFADAVSGADVVCLCTDAASPVISRAWLAPGAHVSSVGASRDGAELDADTVRDADVFVESRVACSPYPAGAHELSDRDPATVTELGEVLSGARPGRSSTLALTLWKSMGHAVEDAVAARLVLDAARAAGVGITVSL